MSPDGLKTGLNSGFSAINLAVHFGAKRIVLLGYDMQPGPQRDHLHPDHPHTRPSPYALFRDQFETMVRPLASPKVSVINCRRTTALTACQVMPLEGALP